jgi:hypothetical protein
MPPFSEEKNKQREFTDAIIIEQLKLWRNDKENITLISNDKLFKAAINEIGNINWKCLNSNKFFYKNKFNETRENKRFVKYNIS